MLNVYQQFPCQNNPLNPLVAANASKQWNNNNTMHRELLLWLENVKESALRQQTSCSSACIHCHLSVVIHRY